MLVGPFSNWQSNNITAVNIYQVMSEVT